MTQEQQAIDDGATEIDMVINIGALKSKDYALVARDIATVVRTSQTGGAITKVIIEAALLNDEEKSSPASWPKKPGLNTSRPPPASLPAARRCTTWR